MRSVLERALLRLDPGVAGAGGPRDIDGNAALRCEWLEADGLGGFASGTVLGIRTRRYHGALLVATQPPADRFLLVQGTEVWVETETGNYSLSANLYDGDVVYPDGAFHLREFTAEPWPKWRFDLPDGTRIVAELYVPRGTAAVVCTWTRELGRGAAFLRVRPLLGPRDPHALHAMNEALSPGVAMRGRQVIWTPYDGVPAIAAASSGTYEHAPEWFHRVLYVQERERGLPDREDVWSPGEFSFELGAERAVLIFGSATAMSDLLSDPVSDLGVDAPTSGTGSGVRPIGAATLEGRWRRIEADRRRDARARARDSYIVRRQGLPAVIAGYPWFGEWGRDTFMAMRGLCFATGKLDEAAALLEGWVDTVSQGMLPNRLPDRGGTPEYNSVDASLWFGVVACELIDACDAAGRPLAAARQAALLDATLGIIDGFVAGTRHRIHVDDDGLVAAGEPGVQLTWMDAKIGDWVVTPRIGKPVEIQALWLNALWIGAQFSNARWRPFLDRGLASFRDRFWNERPGCLYDVIDVDHEPGRVDAAIRPNQIYAVGGLPLALLDGARAQRVVACVEQHLLTPLGLRSLAPADPAYRPRYEGGVRERDSAYHQGTVWPFLIGAFAEAWLRVHGTDRSSRDVARRRFLTPLLAHLDEAALGHVSEIADADAPHRPRGCPWQAWSLGELLRLIALLGHTPVTKTAARSSPRSRACLTTATATAS